MFDKIQTFSKAQVSAFVGGMADYGIMIFLTEVFHIYFTYSIVVGGIIGAIVNFTINKTWAFHSIKNPYISSAKGQLLKFVLVVLNSIFLKSSGKYLITKFLRIYYKISRLIVDLIVSIGVNYTLQRYWVFKRMS